MAGISFEDYLIEDISYKRNMHYNRNHDIKLNTDINAQIDIYSDTEANVKLNVNIGNTSEPSSPFNVSVIVIGKFTFSNEDSGGTSFEQFLSENSIAILFPYVRNLISDITLKSNEFPSLLMPVINVVQLLKDTHAIVVNDLREDNKKPTNY